MSLGLSADDCNDLPSMENWLNAGADWTEHHGIEITASASDEDFFETGSTSSLFESAAPAEAAAAAAARPFLKLDALELCKKASSSSNPTGSSSMVDSSSNEDDGVVVSVAKSLLVENLQADSSPRGPLSPAALQFGKSNNKRSFDEIGASYVSPAFPTAMANSSLALDVAAPGILFPARLTLPNVPSMEEIAQSRPKRRNVKISTDPQSVAARHRRERISDRVRVLQHFVPGGTKMDTASMLDEAIHYVKFLQQQLQTLERLGNNYDGRFMSQEGGVMMPPVGSTSTSSSSAVRPTFDLNCAVYQQLPCTSMMQPQHHQQQQHQQQQMAQNTSWPGAFCSQGFPDSAQEQFCH